MGQQQTSSATANDAAEGGSLVGSPASTNAAAQVCLTDDSHGLQISRVVSGSPAACAGLVPYFDFVLAVDERELQSVDGHRTQFFKDYVASKRGVAVRLQVLNLRTRTMREVLLTPAPWKASSHSLLGCGVDWRSIGVCIKLCWHLVSREAGSPAAMCNKLHDDGSEYLIGMQQSDSPVLSTFQSAEDLSDRVRGWMERRQTLREYAALKMPAHVPTELILMMYHVPSNQVRSVALHVDVAPHAVSLGLGLASGLLHTIPVDASAGVPQMHLMDHVEEALSTPNKPHPGTRSVTTMSSSIGSTNEKHPLQVENTGTFSPSVGNESTHSLTSQLAPGRGPTTEHHHHLNTLPHASSSPPPTPAHPCTSSAETLPAAGTPRAINVPTSSSVVASIPPSGGLKDGSGPHEAPPIISTTTAPLTSTTTATGAPAPVLLEIPPPLRFPLYNPRTHTFREAA